ncbi:translocation protein TolB [Pseudoalteromonas sp. NEC-BIFX-2020_015]|nr:winged helix-turn-helix domain-containing protein [Pseudoalteromonas sp. NEC-BIFX-2020_015]NMR26260.1 translocation protein TolB [Pseudoalteromonas sp. NEC-BIFX-2020_015]
MNMNQPFLLGPCRVLPSENKLGCANVEVVLQPKFIELLCFLVSRYPEAVTREELIENVWNGNSYVGEKALTNAIWHLRKAFKELDPDTIYIETLRKTGYRITLTPCSLTQNEFVPIPTKKSIFSRFSSMQVICAVITVIVFVTSPFYFLHDNSSKTRNYKTRLTDHIETLTTSPGRELFPGVSNDNHLLVYSWGEPGELANLYLQDLFSPEQAAIALTNSDGIEGRAVFSPDQQRIYYYRRSDGGKCDIIEQTLSGAATKLLGSCAVNFTTDLDISAQGDKLVYISERTVDGTLSSELNIINLSSDKAVSQVPCKQACNIQDESVAFSPDGTKLVVSRNLPDGHEELFLIDISSGDTQQLTSGFLDLRGVDWHPQKSQLVFSAVEHGQRQGYFYHLDTNIIQDSKVTGLSYPEYADDGTLYFHQWHTDSTLMRVELGDNVASSPFPVLSTDFNMRYADFNELKNKFTFISNESNESELWIADQDGTNRRQLTDFKSGIFNPIWSPDGRYIAFTLFIKGKNQLYIYDFEKQVSEQLKTGFKYHAKVSWGKDSQTVLVSDSKYVHRFNLNGKNLGKMIEQPAYYAYETQQGDLIFAKPSAKQLWVKYADSGREEVLVPNINLSNDLAWHYVKADETSLARIYYFNVDRADYRLSYYDLANQSHHDVMRLPERAFSRASGLTYIAQSGWLVYSAYKSPQIDIKRIKAQYLP